MRKQTVPPIQDTAPRRLPTLSRMPPLTALRAFVAVARHESFAGAAAELNVSTAAIGQQVRLLELHFGCPLFNRLRGELVLTAAGTALYPGLANAFDAMIESISGLIRAGSRPSLSLLADSSFAARLLAPRIGRIRQGLADVGLGELELSIAALEAERFEPLHFDADCAIVAITEPVQGLVCEPLFDDEAIAACTPEFADRHRLLHAPERLRDASVEILYHTGDDPAFEWLNWLRSCGFAVRPAGTGSRFSNPAVLIEATLAGHGISLLRRSLVQQELRNGRLVMPFGSPQPTPSRYHLVTAPDRRRRPEIAFLLSLLRDNASSVPEAA